MRSHLSLNEFDAFLEGNISEEKKNMAEKHMAMCADCHKRLDILKETGDYLGTIETVDALFTQRVVNSLSKKRTKKKTSSTIKQKKNVLKPILAFFSILAFIALAFYFGTKYDDLRNRTAQQPDITAAPEKQPESTGTALNTTPQATVTPAPAQKEIVILTLYFPTANADAIVPEQRQLEINKGDNLVAVLFKELQKGSMVSDRGSIIPEGSKLLSAKTEGELCTLNLSSEFVDNNPGGTAFEGLLINSIVNTITELPQVKKVQFLINGQKREVYTHVIFNEPFERNESFIKTEDNTSQAVEERLRELGNNTMKALRDRDMKWLSSIVHPDKKLRFSPYTYVNVENTLTFSADEIKTLMNSDKIYHWGTFDGSGDPIDLTFKDYLSKFVYDKDFLNAEKIVYNQYLEQGNIENNIFAVFPEGKLLIYHFPGFDPQFEGLDYESLMLVFEEKDGTWYLVGIVHDQWTI